MEEEEILQTPEEPKNMFEPIDFMIFKDEIQDDFQTIVSKTAPDEKTPKALVLSKYLSPKFTYIFKMQDLLKLGFSNNIYYLENCPQTINEFQIVFLIPSKIECVDIVLKQFKKDKEDLLEKQKNFEANKSSLIEKTYHFYFVPKLDISILNYINENYSLYKAYFDKYFEFELLNFPLDFDLISLEDNQCFKELFLYKFSDCVDNLANLLIKIEEIFGKIKYRYIIGENGQILSKLLDKKEKEGFLSEKNTNEILACFFFDRSVDYITPMITEYTYEAMLHANFNIIFNRMKLKAGIIEDQKNKVEEVANKINSINQNENKINEELKPQEQFKKVIVGMEDKFYYMIKNYNFDKLRIFLSRRLYNQTKHLNSAAKNKNFEDIQQNLKMIQSIKEERASLSNHINIADFISKKITTPRAKRRLQLEQTILSGDKDCLDFIHEYYETEMARKGDPYELLKLFCLENLVFGGVKGKIYDSFKNDFLLTYDEKLFFLIKNLEELKILKKGGSSKLFQICLEKLNLCNEKVNLFHPDDTSYVFSGFSPLSIRLIEKAITQGWSSIQKDVLKNFICEINYPEDERPIIEPQLENNVILLVFIGGITYSEIAAIRYLNKSPKYSKYKFLIITTQVISGNSFFDSIKSDQLELALDLSDKVEEPKEREEKIDPKLLKKLKEKEEKELKKKEKEEKAKQKELEEQQKELERDRAEYRERKKKENK